MREIKSVCGCLKHTKIVSRYMRMDIRMKSWSVRREEWCTGDPWWEKEELRKGGVWLKEVRKGRMRLKEERGS